MALTAAQLAARANRIGGSDAAAIVGKDPHKTGYEVAMRILGQLPPDTELDTKDHILFGNFMEDVLGKMYEVKHPGAKLYTPETVVHPKYPFLAANIDRRIEGNAALALEMKNTGQFVQDTWGRDGTDEAPDRVIIQVQHAMLCDPEIQEFGVLRAFGGNQYMEYLVPRNDVLIDSLLNIELEFYENLKKGVLPTPDWSHSSTSPTLKRAFQKIDGVIEAKPELEKWTACWEEAAAARLEAEKLEDAIKNRIALLMGNAEIGLLPDGRKWRRKAVKRAAYSVEATQFNELRLIKGKA